MMLTFERTWMTLWDIPQEINEAIPALPNKIYVNKLIVQPLHSTFVELIETGYAKEIKTWDGSFNIRKKRGQEEISTHAFAISVDMNAAWNRMGGKVSWSEGFLNVWRKNGWICGADWKGKGVDGMHFQGDNFIK